MVSEDSSMSQVRFLIAFRSPTHSTVRPTCTTQAGQRASRRIAEFRCRREAIITKTVPRHRRIYKYTDMNIRCHHLIFRINPSNKIFPHRSPLTSVPTMAPRPEGRRNDIVLIHNEEDDGGDEDFGRTFGFELDALEHTLDEFSELLKEPSQINSEEALLEQAPISEDEASFSHIFAAEVNALDGLFNEFTKLVQDDIEGSEQDPMRWETFNKEPWIATSISEEYDGTGNAMREDNFTCNDENDVCLFTGGPFNTKSIRSGFDQESTTPPLHTMYLEMEPEDYEYRIRRSESLDSIYTIGGDIVEIEERQPIVFNSLWQCDAMAPFHSLLETKEGAEINDDDTLFSLRQQYKKETVSQALWNIMVFQREQLEKDFPMLLRQLEKGGNDVSKQPDVSSKKEDMQGSIFSFFDNILAPTPPLLHSAAVHEPGAAHPDLKEEPNFEGMENEAIECCKDINEISVYLATSSELLDTIEILGQPVREMRQELSKGEPSCHAKVNYESEQHVKTKECIPGDPVIGNIEIHCDEINDMREAIQEFDPCPLKAPQTATSPLQVETLVDSRRSDDDSGDPFADPSRPYKIISNHAKDPANREEARPWEVFTKFDLDDEEGDGDFRLHDEEDYRDAIEEMRGEVDVIMEEVRDDLGELTAPRASMQVGIPDSTYSSISKEIDDPNMSIDEDSGDLMVPQQRPYKIFTMFDLDDDEEETVDFRLFDQQDDRDEVELRQGEDDFTRQEQREEPSTLPFTQRMAISAQDDGEILHIMEDPKTLRNDSSNESIDDEDAGDPNSQGSSSPYKIFTKFDLDDEEEEEDGDSHLEYFARLETPKVRNCSPAQVATYDSKSTEFSSVGSNVWGQWPFFSPSNPEDMFIQRREQQEQEHLEQEQEQGFILQQASDLSTLSGSFSLEFGPIDVRAEWMPTSPQSPYLLRLVGTENFFSEDDDEHLEDYQCFQNQDSQDSSSIDYESRIMDPYPMIEREDHINHGPNGDQRDEWNRYYQKQEEGEAREDCPDDDEFIRGRKVLSPKNSSAWDYFRDSPPDDILVDHKGIKDDDGCSVSTVGNGSIIWSSGNYYAGGKKPIAVPDHHVNENMVDKILLEHCPSDDQLPNIKTMDASKRLLHQILVGTE